jgi:tetratricopeptide (TPR) repeat protein
MDKMTFGLGFAREPFGINYAYLSQDALGAIHRFEVTWRFGEPLEQEQRRDKLFSEAEVLYSESRMMRARATLNEVLAISPNNQKANRLQKKIDSRIATSMDPETLFILGEQAYTEGRYEQSADLFRRLTEVDPKYPEATERLEKAEVKAGEIRLREAEARLKEERLKENRARQNRAKKLTTEKKWREAMEAWEKVLELTPGDGDAKRALARCQEEAHLMDVQGKEDAKQLYEKGMIVYSEKDFEKARWYFEQALKANPNDKKAAKALEHIIEEGKHLP